MNGGSPNLGRACGLPIAAACLSFLVFVIRPREFRTWHPRFRRRYDVRGDGREILLEGTKNQGERGGRPPAPSLQSAGSKYLIADLRGGLTNQAIEVWTALLVAMRLNRTLVLPRVRARVPAGEIYAGQGAGLRRFGYLWDRGHFVRCAENRLNVSDAIDTNFEHNKVEVGAEHSYELQKFDGQDNISPLLQGTAANATELVMRLRRDNVTYVKVINPFVYSVVGEWDLSDCFVPSRRWWEEIDRYQAMLPANYSCLHARIEIDWFSIGCCDGKADTSGEYPHMWTCTVPLRPNCYKTPTQIVDILESEGLSMNSSLWISSGAPPEALRPLRKAFDVHVRDPVPAESHFMDYGLAMVDREVCSGAHQFWGMSGSTFSMEVAARVRKHGGVASFYNTAALH